MSALVSFQAICLQPRADGTTLAEPFTPHTFLYDFVLLTLQHGLLECLWDSIIQSGTVVHLEKAIQTLAYLTKRCSPLVSGFAKYFQQFTPSNWCIILAELAREHGDTMRFQLPPERPFFHLGTNTIRFAFRGFG